MNDKEKKLWQWIKNGGLPGNWVRVDAVSFPDCIVHHGRTFLVELKVVENWREDPTLGLRSDQAVWIDDWRAKGGEAYVLARIGGELFWFTDVIALRRRMASPALAVPGPFHKG